MKPENKNKVLVILDTNKIKQNLDWTSDFSKLIFKGDCTRLIDYSEKNNLAEVLDIGFPDIVIREFIVSQKNNFDTIIKRIKEDYNKIKNFDFVSKELKIESSEFDYKNYLETSFNNIFRDKKYLIPMKIAYNIESYENIVERAINKKKPFTENGDKGFKDALIWECIFNSNYNSKYIKVFLFTENSKDFTKELEDEFKKKTGIELEILSNYEQLEQELYSLLHYYVDSYELIKFQQTEYYQDKLKEIVFESAPEGNIFDFHIINWGAGIEKFDKDYAYIFEIEEEDYLNNQENYENCYMLFSEVSINGNEYLVQLLFDERSKEIISSNIFETNKEGELV